MYRLRISEGLTLRELGQRFGVGPERARQLLNRYVRQTTSQPVDARAMTRTAAAVRRAADFARAQTQAEELLAAWREGQEVEQIAKTFDLRCRSVAEVLKRHKTLDDHAARAAARRLLRAESANESRRSG